MLDRSGTQPLLLQETAGLREKEREAKRQAAVIILTVWVSSVVSLSKMQDELKAKQKYDTLFRQLITL